MGLLHDRKETKEKIIVVFKYELIYYILFFALLIIPIFDGFLAILTYPLLMILIFIKIATRWNVHREIKKAMKDGHVKVSGSRWSLDNPVTFEISKK